ncbi:MAG TPA: DUF262 domain-containing protein [Candidatus Wujingus californicus]|uniref:DUF262 domain-containing protein n=1 Tax=Candidatus Wujingus californicus TaxID=3367618 RepID=UPI004027E157
MKRRIEEWTVDETYRKRDQIVSPDFQRNPKLWNREDKRLLIDSILNNIDIPKLYLNDTENEQEKFEVIDGQQRLWAIWEFLENEYTFETKDKTIKELEGKKFEEFPHEYKDKIVKYKLQFTIISGAEDEYLRKLFLRLQLGLLLVAGEKLHAETGQIRDFVFKEMVMHPFILNINIPGRRYAKETLCAQICINSFKQAKVQTYSRTRYEDLYYFFKEHKKVTGGDLQFFEDRCKNIMNVLTVLDSFFQQKAIELRNRSFVLSVYLFVEKLFENKRGELETIVPKFVEFVFEFFKRLKEEAKAGFDRTNEELYKFESFLSNAPGEKYQIERRHEKLKEFFDYYQERKKIKGD